MSGSFPLFYVMIIAVFLGVSMFTHGLFTYTYNRRIVKERYRNSEGKRGQRFGAAEISLKQRLLDRLSAFGRFALKDQVGTSSLRSVMAQAGFRNPSAPAIYIGLRCLTALSLPIPILLINLWQGMPSALILLVSLILLATGYYAPCYGLRILIRRRQDHIDQALPDMLDLMTVTMEAGLALQATINRVSEEIKSISPELSDELQVTSVELRSGLPRDLALRNMGKRTGVQSVQSLVAMMIQSEKMGASISQGLRTHAEFIRNQRSQRAEEIANKLPVKILFPLMFFILPALFIVIIGPAAINISKTLLK